MLGVGLVVTGGWGAHHLDRQRRIAACESDGATIDDHWNDDARAELREGLLATGVGHAEATAERVMPWLDRQAQAWRGARTEACLDTKVRDRWDAETLESSLRALAAEMEVGAGKLIHPLRVALTGNMASPGIFDVLVLLGRERSEARMEDGVKRIREAATEA